jgi:xanthine/uracil permease
MYKYDSEKGFSTGLMMWLLCLLILVFLGIQPIISVLFGAAAGAATWLIVAYWNFEPIPPEEGKEPTDEPTPSVFNRFRVPLLFSEEGKIRNPFARRKPRNRI